jgi:cardiolipin synthase
MSWINAGWLLLDLAIIAVLLPTVIMQRKESGATLAWIMAIVLVPFVGLLAFWIFGTTRLRLRRRKRQRIEARLAPALHKLQAQSPTDPSVGWLPPSLLKLTESLDETGPQPGNEVTVLREGQAAFDTLEAAIDSSRHHVHLVYYIWEPDRTGARLRDALMRAARRGVQIRLLLDDVGSRGARRGFFQVLVEAGGRVERFLRVNPLSRQLGLNNRNHRKIVVVDGETGFTGSMNVGDVYAGLGEPWRDLHARIRGPVVNSLQEIFCQDWYQSTGDDLVNADYFPKISGAGHVWAQILASGPADERWRAIYALLFGAITLARRRVWIVTPYFVPDPPFVMALQTAALRGVDVRLLLPGRSDHPLVLRAGRSFQDELLVAGVRIFELHGTMPHAKTVTIDGIVSTLGSANMDQRSFRLNFEANVFFFDAEVAAELERDFLSLCFQATAITALSRQGISRRQRLTEGIGRMLAPLL